MSTVSAPPLGLCECGCGGRTRLAPQTHRKRGWIKGQPVRFLPGHVHRHHPDWWDQAYTIVPGPLPTPCHVWAGRLDEKGYADRITVDGEVREPHAVYYERANGPMPKGTEPDHLCRNRACVNPDHLEPVTHAENMRRGAVAKLDVERVRTIRRRVQQGEAQAALAREYGVGRCCINGIVKRRNWRDV